ncbi:FlgO family outer membrane protein [Kineobactrum salinum]|nr:FlgO family outer membrane protein [Kineobactrum salinum]
MYRVKNFAVAAIACVLLSACASQGGAPTFAAPQEVDVVKLMNASAADLVANASGLPPGGPIIAATFVDIDNLQQSSTLGRTLAEMFATGLVRAGLTVMEVKMRDSLFIRETTGELILSRDIRRLSASHDAQAVLIGTYAQAESMVYLNVRIVRSSDNVVLGASNVQLPMDKNIRAMLSPAW